MPLRSRKNDVPERNVLSHLHKYVHAIARTISYGRELSAACG